MKRLALLIVVLAACQPVERTTTTAYENGDLAGIWRSVLESPGGELPFALELSETDGRLTAVFVNGTEQVKTSAVTVNGTDIRIDMDWYDSRLEGHVSGGGPSIEGRWVKTVPGGESTLPWRAERGSSFRFSEPAVSGLAADQTPHVTDVGGHWMIEFDDDEIPARGELVQDGHTISGTILTSTGDYRFLAGDFRSGVLRLSTFDGAHAFLFRAEATADGTLRGDFWSRDTYHTGWTARRIDADEELLPDPWVEVTPTDPDRRFRFAFDDLEGRPMTDEDPRFDGKVQIAVIFGSWCPNCNDEAQVLASWASEYHDRGLEIVGLAFEFSGDPDRDRRVLRRYADRHGIDFPILLAGISDKAEASLALPDISRVLSFPTTVFLDRNRRIRWIHSGFAGPGTGHHHDQLVKTMEERIELLLAE